MLWSGEQEEEGGRGDPECGIAHPPPQGQAPRTASAIRNRMWPGCVVRVPVPWPLPTAVDSDTVWRFRCVSRVVWLDAGEAKAHFYKTPVHKHMDIVSGGLNHTPPALSMHPSRSKPNRTE